MSTPTTHLAMSQPADGDTSWGSEIRNAMVALDALSAPDNVVWVSPQFDTANLGNGSAGDRRHFDTIQGAIDKIEAGSSDVFDTILVYPGDYTEELTITQSMHIHAIGGRWGCSSGLTTIRGAGTAPCVTINPQAATEVRVGLSGLRLINDVSTYGGVTTAWPFWIDVNDQGSGNYGPYHNKIHLIGCHLYVTALDNASDKFTYGIAADGFNQLILERSQFRIPNDKDFTYPIHVAGNTANGVSGQLYAKRCEFLEYGTTGATISLDDTTDGVVYDCAFFRSRANTVAFGGTGANVCEGLNDDTEFADYKNVSGVAAVFSF